MALPAAFVAVFLLYPLARILVVGFGPVAAGGATALWSALEDSNLGRVLPAAAGQGFLSSVLSLALGLPTAYVFGRYSFRGKGALRVLLSIPFVLPTVVVSAAFVELIGARGLVVRALQGLGFVSGGMTRTLGAVLAAHVFYNTGVVVRIVGSAWAAMDPRLPEAARTLGARRTSALVRVTVPLLLPAIAASALLVFVFCFSSFGVILILGGPRMGTVETEIYRQAVNMFNLPAAAALSVVQLAATVAVMFVYSRLQALTSTAQRIRAEGLAPRQPRSASARALIGIFGYGVAALFAVPLGALVVGSLLGSRGFSLSFWSGLFAGSGHSFFWASPFLASWNSLRFALAATAVALFLGIPGAYAIARTQVSAGASSPAASAIDVLFLLPLGTSAVTLGFGFIVAMGAPPLNLRGSPALIPIAHALVALPLVIRSILPALQTMNPHLREAASTLGARPSAGWRAIDLPLLARSFGTAAAFAFTVSLGEFGATALLTRPELVTLPVLVYSSLTRAGEASQGQALAASTLLMALCGVGLASIERLRPGSKAMF